MNRYRPHVETLEARTLPSTAQFVASLFQDLLQRAPTQAESTNDTNLINQGMPAVVIAQGLTNSTEYSFLTTKLDYQNILGRTPSVPEMQYWAGVRTAARFNPQQQMAAILASNEYFGKEGNDPSTWLAGVYQIVLHRAPDVLGQASFGAQNLQDPAVRAQVASAIVHSLEASEDDVRQAYQLLLHRDADAQGLNYWAQQLSTGVSVTQMLSSIAGSHEYVTTRGGGLDSQAPPA